MSSRMPIWFTIIVSMLAGATAALASVYAYVAKNWPRP